MDKTEEFWVLATQNQPKDRCTSPIDPLATAISLATEQREALISCYNAIDRATSAEYAEIERSVKVSESQEESLKTVLESIMTEDNSMFLNGIALALHTVLQKVRGKLETKRHRKRRSTLNIALEPEKAPSTRTPPPMMQLLREENERILESVQYTEREVATIQRKISEIDTLQKLITQEIFSQDERIDTILTKTTSASVDVRISKNYLRSATERRKASRRFLSMLILIFALVLLLLHFSK
ncbi:hypothetical protein NEHOM01_0595 [Nematocida homosporus]|uniref:uncharacterized protein n=1 Tax=Nematocida homosporus TaxID=1912981 RepID=UPI00221EB609|nr:uncharacterized protein NEHOM01_0595 [Nematocida homosporus]KAI5185090.1 hypothetical protein NEHOM01_0595 [Nematocida homosporus]